MDAAEVPAVKVRVVAVAVPPSSLKQALVIEAKLEVAETTGYPIQPRARALGKVAVPIVVVHVEGREGHPVVAIEGVSSIAIV